MNWELYEVWAEDTDGHEELVETTRSRSQAFKLAQQALIEGYTKSIVYQENSEGDLDEIKRFKNG